MGALSLIAGGLQVILSTLVSRPKANFFDVRVFSFGDFPCCIFGELCGTSFYKRSLFR